MCLFFWCKNKKAAAKAISDHESIKGLLKRKNESEASLEARYMAYATRKIEEVRKEQINTVLFYEDLLLQLKRRVHK